MNRRYFRRIATALVVAVIVLSVFFITGQVTRSCGSQAQSVTSQEAFDLIQENQGNSGFIILDVRTSSEYSAGHIKGALNIDVRLPSFGAALELLSKDDTYLVYCRTGNRSRNALCQMEELGLPNTYHLSNGITEWVGAGFPVSR
ncbi:MAG: rhodanese-like domain-containing protein [Dehalococcoidia bacterium]